MTPFIDQFDQVLNYNSVRGGWGGDWGKIIHLHVSKFKMFQSREPEQIFMNIYQYRDIQHM